MALVDFSNFSLARFFGTWVSGLGKRHGEKWYDRLPELPFFQELLKQAPFVKHSIENFAYAFTGILDQTVGEDTFFKKLFKELGMDFGSEFSKRLMNGEHVKEILVRNPGHWETREEKELISILSDMEDADLMEFLKWANTTTAKERRQDIANLRKMTAEQIIKRSKNPELFKDLLQYLRGPKKGPSAVSEFVDPFRQKLIERAMKRKGGSDGQPRS